MLTSSSHCKIRRKSVQSEIKSILKKNSVVIQSTHGILIGSRAARHYLPNFREIRYEKNADWNILSSSEFFLAWWHEQDERVKTIDLIILKSEDGSKLDFYIYCIMQDGSKYNFIIPRSSLTYTAYLLENSENWIIKQFSWTKLIRKGNCIVNASEKLLLILKKYMLYYTHQWMKTAKDYRQLLTITNPLTDDDSELCDLIVHYNEKIYGKRPLDTDQFDTTPYDGRKNISINRNEFFQQKKSQRIEFVYQIAMSMSTTSDIMIGFEHLCTQSPLWLADYVIDNWISIQNEKFKQKFQLFHPCMKFESDNHHCLFPQLPKNVTQRILHNITDVVDFYSIQFVCKQWYAILHEESFWRDLYISRYGIYSTSTCWKMLYLMRIEGKLINENSKFDELINASIDLRQLTGNDVFKLWEDLTHQEQHVDSVILSRIQYILFNAFYYQIDETSNEYSVKLIINGLEDVYSLSKIHLIVHVGEYKTSHFTDYMEELLIECKSNDKIRYSLNFRGPNLVGFDFDYLGYISSESTLLTSTLSHVFQAFPIGLLICLFIMMTHPIHRIKFIKYLKSLENRCMENLSDCNNQQ
jgi:hypothetical protein